MGFLRSKSAQLAEHLRAEMDRGRLVEPLPGSRLWSKQLGVGRRTLNAAIDELRREGRLVVGPRGVRLGRRAFAASAKAPPRVVRILRYGPETYSLDEHLEILLSSLRERLLLQGIDFRQEILSPSRLRAIVKRPTSANELLILRSLPPAYQRMFASAGRPVVVFGEAARGLSIPSISADMPGTVRHAAFNLLRRGIRRIGLIHPNVSAPGIKRMVAMFREACATWPQQPVMAETFATAIDFPSLSAAAREFAESITERTGAIVVPYVPAGLIATALLQHGIAIPEQVTIASIFEMPIAVKLYPPPIYYPWPVDQLVKQLAGIATTFFATGQLPTSDKRIPSEVAEVE